jgi:hypothetical protein
MGRTPRRVAAVSLVVALMLSLPATASAALTDHQRAKRGSAYLVGTQRKNGSIPAFSPIGSTADAVLAFVASGVGREQMQDALGYLRQRASAGAVSTIGLRAKVVLAASAAGKDPRAFGGHDLVQEIRSTVGGNGHLGGTGVFDDALGVLALVSAGISPAAKVSTWLLAAQCPAGGWAYDAPYDPTTDDAHCHSGGGDFFDADSNTTSYVVQALVGTGHTGWTHGPFAFFASVRDPAKGGWSYAPSFVATDANSTALVIQAYVAHGTAIPSGGLIALRKLQYPSCGAWAYAWNGGTLGDPNVGATIGAIPALLRRPLPLPHRTLAAGVPSVPACG